MGTISGSKDPKNRALGPKYHKYYSIWALKPYYLSPWTLRIKQGLGFKGLGLKGLGQRSMLMCLGFWIAIGAELKSKP